MTGSDVALQREVIALFRGQAESLGSACGGEAWRDAVHTLKGAARGIGLQQLAAACEAAEAAQSAEALAEVQNALASALAALAKD